MPGPREPRLTIEEEARVIHELRAYARELLEHGWSVENITDEVEDVEYHMELEQL